MVKVISRKISPRNAPHCRAPLGVYRRKNLQFGSSLRSLWFLPETLLIFRDYSPFRLCLFSILTPLDGCRGILYEPSSPGDTNIGKKIKEGWEVRLWGPFLIFESTLHGRSLPRDHENCANFSLVKMGSMIRIRRIMDAYNDDKVYSVELVRAASLRY